MLHDESKLKSELDKVINRFKDEVQSLNTGKANIESIQQVEVEAYGANVPLNSVGQVVINDAITATVTVWDKNLLQTVDAALRESSIGASVSVDKDIIRLKFNPMTEEDRASVVKELKQMLETARIAARHIRQEHMKKVQGMEGVSEDQQEMSEEAIQKEIDKTIEELEILADKKEETIMKV